MGRKLEPGESGEMNAVPQRKDADGKWKTCSVRSAQRWRAYVRYCGHDGVSGTATGFGEKKRFALERCQENLDRRLRGAGAKTTHSTKLVDAGREWLDHIARPGSGKSERTLRDYQGAFERTVDATGSDVRGLTLKQANDPQIIRRFLQKIADERGTGAAKHSRCVLSGIIGFAVQNGVLQSNAVRQVESVRSVTKRASNRDHRRAFTRDERDEFLAFAVRWSEEADLHPRTRLVRRQVTDFTAFLGGTAVRISEARRLRWEDVHLGNAWVHIRGTKSTSADRTLNLPEWLVLRLKLALGDEQPSGYVFPSPQAGREIEWDQSNNSKAVRRLLDAADCPWAVSHTFRRTVATLLDEAAVPLPQIADQLGHADPAMTARVYLGRSPHGDKSLLAVHL